MYVCVREREYISNRKYIIIIPTCRYRPVSFVFFFFCDYDTTAGIYILYIVLRVHTVDPNIRYELRTTGFVGAPGG